MTSLKLLCAIFLILLHLKPALGGDGNIWCIERERQALLEFKKGLIDNSNLLSSWGSENAKKNCCTWEGVYCSKHTGHVVKLDLALRSYLQTLGGKVGPSLAELKYLSFLDLTANDFTPSYFPVCITSLSNLKYLSLAGNNIFGPIPFQLYNLSRLRYLDLGFNYFKIEKLEGFSHFVSLETLYLGILDLSLANDWLEVVGNLPKLSSLGLSDCRLPLMPHSHLHINYSQSLTNLALSGTLITSLIFPWVVNSGAKLVSLGLSRNELNCAIPSAFGNLSSITKLDLSDNHFEGGIPKSFMDICTLSELNLVGNKLDGQVLDFFHDLKGCMKDSLEHLYLDDNQITGLVPNFAIFPSLSRLGISSNKLYGTFSEAIGSLYKLEILNLASNMLEGVVSDAQLSNFPNLTSLDLSNDLLTLSFNFDWVPPFQLEYLSLRSCNLGPDFPEWIKTQNKLEGLDLSSSGISSSIPTWFWDKPFVFSYLNLSHNQIEGRLQNMSTLFQERSAVDLSSNRFEGPIPPMFLDLFLINFSKNKFSSLHSFVCSKSDNFWTFIDLSSNSLFERIPNCFTQFQYLEVLNLANNSLYGEIPHSMGSLERLVALDLSDNNLSRELPLSLQNCTRFRYLNLGGNKLSGRIPAWIGERWSSLIILSLRSNKFHGSIQFHICLLGHIRFLDLSGNNISGTIPRCLNNLTSMANNISDYMNDEYYNWNVNVYSTSIISIADHVGAYFLSFDVACSLPIIVGWKGNVYEYGKNFGEMRSIDLANNKLTGKIPDEICSLTELIALNLSGNMLGGIIPQNIGQLEQLESLDLSRNQFFGPLPTSMARLHYLGYLNLSYNEFSGRIPLGTQIQSFNPDSFIGNHGLCGSPLIEKCPEDVKSNTTGDSKNYQGDGDEFWKCFYAGMVLGFIVGFWGVCGSLILNRSWRYAYFLLLINLKDWLYVTIIVHATRLEKMFHN